jgi:hypothetical protein
MPPQISLNELYNMRKRKHTSRTLSYDHVLELCHRRVRTVASYGGLNAFYEIPGMIVGYPLFSIHACLEYVVEALRNTGFLVQILPPPHVAVMYISWDPEELKPRAGRYKAIENGGGNSGSAAAVGLGALGGIGRPTSLPAPEDPRAMKPYRNKEILRLF